jgi:membrane protease YdiL (CAAX protease family)
MLSDLTGPVKAAIFYIVTLGLALILAVFFSGAFGEATAMLTMLTPATAMLIMMLVVTGEGRSRAGWVSLGVNRLGLNGWWLAILGPAVILLVSDAILIVTGLASLRAPVIGASTADIVINLAVSLAMGVLLGFTEEVGWRGYMLPRLAAIGLVPAMLVVGLAQGVWHLPLMLLTPFYHSGGNPMIVVPFFLITLTLAGIFYGYLRVWTGSVWPVAIAHAVYNFFWNVGSEFVEAKSPETMEYIGGESGILVIAGLIIAALAIVPRLRGTALAPNDRPVMA